MGFVASKAAMRSVLVTSIGLTFTTASSAFAQETLTSLTSVSSITGDCKSELAGADLGCAGIASYASFKTGRELFNFPGTEVIAVAGPTAEQAKDGKATLRIDHVYISKTLVEADGQCSIQVPGGNNKTRIECGAVLRDGRKLAVSFSSDAKWKVSFGVPGDVAA